MFCMLVSDIQYSTRSLAHQSIKFIVQVPVNSISPILRRRLTVPRCCSHSHCGQLFLISDSVNWRTSNKPLASGAICVAGSCSMRCRSPNPAEGQHSDEHHDASEGHQQDCPAEGVIRHRTTARLSLLHHRSDLLGKASKIGWFESLVERA